jgi:hypothetical protein
MEEVTKLCKWCGGTKPLSAFHAHARMKDGHLNKCSGCVIAYVSAWKLERRGGRVVKFCVQCGGAIVTTGRDASRRRFCSPACKAAGRYRLGQGAPQIVSAACPACGVEYSYPVPGRKRETCGKRACITANTHRKAKAQRAEAWVERDCVHCGLPIPFDRVSTHPYAKDGVRKTNKTARFCSEACNSKAHALTRKIYRRAGQTKVEGYLVLRADIAERDRWLCGICGGRVSRERRHPDPLCASVDHIVPLALDGTNDFDNLQLTHLRCNLSKKATLAV